MDGAPLAIDVAAERGPLVAIVSMFGTRSIAAAYDRKSNSFTPVRLVLALLVLYSHAFALAGQGPGEDQLKAITNGQATFGFVAVLSFFAISGFLVTQSAEGIRGRWWMFDFLARRGLRIMPALVVMALIMVAVVGPLSTKYSMAAYLWTPSYWNPRDWFVDTVTFQAFGWHVRVRDVFADTPVGAAMNGSLWSLRYEVAAYLALVVGAVVVRRRLGLIATPLALLFGALVVARFFGLPTTPIHGPWVLSQYDDLIFCGSAFFSGSVLYLVRDRVPAAPAWIAAAGVVMVAGMVAGPTRISLLLLPYVVIALAISPRLAAYERRVGDYSYATYLYAWPVEQSIVHLAGPMDPYRLALFAALITVALAIVSWHLIEAPAINLKRVLARTRPLAEAPATANG